MARKRKERLEDMQCSRDLTPEENERIMRAHRRYEERVRAELGMESQIIETADPRYFTRLDMSRILETDEDNLY